MQTFNLSNQHDFDTWSKWKLSLYSSDRIEGLLKLAKINPDESFEPDQRRNLRQNISAFNLSLYRIIDPDNFDSGALSRLGRQFGLFQIDTNLCAEDDRITIISDHSDQESSGKHRQRYIPFSNRALGWHTDGYYNPSHQRVRSFILHCAQPAASGGVNRFIDPDIIYILLRRENSFFIDALSNPEVMRIPENRVDEGLLRPETATSVFQLSLNNTVLDMRYSQRKRHITWCDDALTREALAFLDELLESNTPWHIEYRLKAGEGIVSNNVLHQRDAYRDDADRRRVYYRARYYSRVNMA